METDALLLLQIIDRSPEYIFWKDSNGLYLGCNENFVRLLGFQSSDQLIGRHDRDLPWGETTAYHYVEEDAYIMETGQSVLQKKVPLMPVNGGDEKWLYVSKVPLFDKNRKINGILGVFIDVTLQEKHEAMLVEQRNLAQAANIAKSEFLANMSHDMRTPLTGILGLAQLASGIIKDEQLAEYLELIELSGQKLLDLLNGCIEAAHADANDLAVQIKPFTVIGVMDNIESLFRASLRHKNLGFHVNYHETMESYLETNWLGAELAISRVLQNLVSNAIKFTEQGDITISVRMGEKSSPTRPLLMFDVVDTGTGIPENKLKTLFEKFTRLNMSYEGMYVGSGLGLYVVKKYLDAIEGQIFVESQEGVGSQFSVIFPVKESFLSANEIKSSAFYG